MPANAHALFSKRRPLHHLQQKEHHIPKDVFGYKKEKKERKKRTEDVLEQISILSSHPSPGSLKDMLSVIGRVRELCYFSARLLVAEVSLDGYQVFLKT